MANYLLAGQADEVVRTAIQKVLGSDDELPVPLEGDTRSIIDAIHRATNIPLKKLNSTNVSPGSGLVTREPRHSRDYVVLLQRQGSGVLQHYIAKPSYGANLP